MTDFLTQVLGNPARTKLLRVFVFNEGKAFLLVDAAKRAGVAAVVAAREIKTLEQWGVLRHESVAITLKNKPGHKVSAGKQKISAWAFNTDFRHARALAAFVHEASPVRHDVVMRALKRGGKLAAVILSGTFMGDPSRPADLIVAADTFNEHRMEQAIRDLEPTFGWEIRYAAFSTPEFRYRLTIQDRLIRDTLEYPHLVLLDRSGLL
jgi:hypothetical protein